MTLKYGEVFLVNCGLSGVPSIEVPSFQGLEGVSPDSLFTQDPPPPVSSNPDSPMAAVLFS